MAIAVEGVSEMKIPHLPPPGSFTEGQRALFGCLISAAGMTAFLFAVWMVLILVHGGWPAAHYGKIIDYLGWALLIALALMALVMAALSVGGPVGRFKGEVRRDGLSWEASKDGQEATVTVETKPSAIDVKVEPGPKP